MYFGAGSFSRIGTDAAGAAVAQDVVFPHPPAFVLAASANIAAGAATATTPQLVPPSGKTFAAGRVSDDTNPLPALDLPLDGYTELELCVQAVAGVAQAGAVYEFAQFDDWTPLGVVYARLLVADLEQTHYRWRNDDGNEAGASSKAAQDAPLTAPVLTAARLRTQVDSVTDRPSEATKQKYRKTDSLDWRTVQ